MAKRRQKKYYKRSKKFKKFLEKKQRVKSVFLSFWSRSVDFIDFRVDKLGDKLCLGRQIILSLYRKAFRETFCFCLTNLKLSRSLIQT